MTPLSPQEKQAMLSRPGVAPVDIEEYERLNAERFTRDPSLPAALDAATSSRESRLAELYMKLYGKNPGEPPTL